MKQLNQNYLIAAGIWNAILITLGVLAYFFFEPLLALFNMNSQVFNFENPAILWALLGVLLIPLITGYNWMIKRKRQSIFSHVPPYSRHWIYQLGQLFTLQIAFISLVIAMAQPQLLVKQKESETKNYDLYLAVDLSQSMDAMDDKKQSRLFYTQKAIEKLIKRLDHQRVALIPFAGEAQVQVPISSDQGNLIHYLKYLNTQNTIKTPGSNIFSALELIKNNIEEEKNKKNAAILLFSDGEDHENESIAIAKILKEMGVPVFPIGIGSKQPQLIPIKKNGAIVDYKKDQNGNTVSTTINETFLKEIARNAGSFYSKINAYQFDPNPILKQLDEEIAEERKLSSSNVFDPQYQFFTLISLLFFSIHFLGMLVWKK